MKKIISLLVIVLALTVAMSVSAFAAKEFALADGYTAPTGVTVTPAADSIAVTVPATDDADYSVLLVNGSDLPTSETGIAYINQVQADGNTVTFNVLPKLGSCGAACTLYIGTNATGENLISIPVTYVEPAPTGFNVAFMNGAETVATLTTVDGKVTAPVEKPTLTPASGSIIGAFTFDSWVNADNTVSYGAGAEITATEDVILYAKYSTGMRVGDINLDKRVQPKDRNELATHFAGTTNANVSVEIIKNGYIGSKSVSSVKVGDINLDGRVQPKDRNELATHFAGTTNANVNELIYYINK